MKVIKRGFLISLVLLVAAGCSHQVEPDAKSAAKNSEAKQAGQSKQESKVEGNIPEAARTVEGMINQKPGVLVDKHIDPELETASGWKGMDYIKFYDKTFKPLAEKEIRKHFEKQESITADSAYNYLVHMLGSGLYKDYYDQLVNYDHGFVMPELPEGPDQVETKQKKVNVMVLVDASGSMKEKVAGGVKMDLAKETVAKFVEQLPAEANVSLLAYGHVGSGSDADKAESCSKIDTVYPLNKYDAVAFNQSMNSFNAAGWTPLAGAIEKAFELLQRYSNEEYHNIVYIVSDGIETCDGDPVQAAKKLQENNINAKLNIIGFDVDDKGQQQLKQVAEAGQGTLTTVSDKAELETTILKKWRPTIGQLVWTQGVTLADSVKATERMNNIFNPLYHSSDNEMIRIQNAAYFLNSEELISDEVEDELLQLIREMHELRYSHFKKIREEKDQQREAAEKEIDGKVEEWRKQWETEPQG
ncbi:vWA domain-containing protein [Bacillus sp. T33-2]|uniref:vWA domain-containing protein n=1 Tax=Bacillus sp. T33-2 TaxID=2054168 RepID=UPI000C77A609|nr:VWA domain-containing protein [Bacillus sp. T33-2]PLR92542.1 amino acid dehydrogenase [Bacillus sp. T33-2]